MNTLRGSNTSFDPMDWFKKMTDCLANKKNCKINLSRVPGGKEIKENKRLPPKITNHHLQNKFLAKYNEKRQTKEQEDSQHNVPRPNMLGFEVKQRNPPAKRPNKDEDYINLPPTFFKSTNVPDLSIFKVPEVPLAKKPRIEKPQSKTADFTLDTLFSGSFKPPKASTPLEAQPKPLLSSPSDILNAINESRLQVVQAFEKSRSSALQQEDPNLKEFLSLVDKVAKKIDSTCFSNVSNPIADIISELQQTHDVATQSPRNSLYSPTHIKPSQELLQAQLSSVSRAKPSSQPRPVPVFFENHDIEMDDDQSVNDSIFDTTFASIATFTTSSRAHHFEDFESPSTAFNFSRDDDINFSPVNFGTPFSRMMDNESIFGEPENDEDERNWFDNFFNDEDFEENEFEASVSADIFRSPPTQRSTRYDLKRKFNEAFNVGRQNSNRDDSSLWSDDIGASAMFDTTFGTL